MENLERTGFSVPKGKRICSVCGEVKRLSHFDGDSDRCADCCEKMVRTSVKWYCVPIALIFVLATVVSVYLTVITVPFIKSLDEAEKFAEGSNLSDAFDYYENNIMSMAESIDASVKEKLPLFGENKFFVPGTETFERYCEICAMADSEYEAGVLVQELFDKDFIKKNKTFSDYVSVTDAYDKVFATVQEINGKYEFTSAEDLRYDEIIAQFEKEKQNTDSPYEKGYYEYFKASVTQFYYDGKDELVEKVQYYLDEMIKFLPNEYAVYGSTVADSAFRSGDYDKAVEAAEFVLSKNRNLTEPYEWLAKAYYKKGETEKAFEVIERLNEAVPQSPVYYKLLIKYNLLENNIEAAEKASAEGDAANGELCEMVFNMYLSNNVGQIKRIARQVFAESIDFKAYQCALLLLKDEKQKAFETAYNDSYYRAYYYAYITGDTSLLSQGVINMTTLCAELCRDKAAVDDISQYGMCDSVTEKVINGELSFEDVFINGKAEIL
ncbi:MAG: tetratricopeptide repeat protein [Clostridia bacterium]|nr:tetratricopeptide repeat protein [Clostridia bacterium]